MTGLTTDPHSGNGKWAKPGTSEPSSELSQSKHIHGWTPPPTQKVPMPVKREMNRNGREIMVISTYGSPVEAQLAFSSFPQPKEGFVPPIWQTQILDDFRLKQTTILSTEAEAKEIFDRLNKANLNRE